MPQQSTVFQGALGPELEKSYVHLPFEVPAGVARIEVEYSYSEQIGSDPLLTGGNTLDLGVFDERGIDFLKAGFRGWSGSERDHFFIAHTEATPGYLAGAIHPGRWNVLLGLYKIAPQGCSYQVKVTLDFQEGAQTDDKLPVGMGDLPASSPPAPFAPWLRGELHCHTWHSDGALSPAALVQLARERGMDFLAISDHNSTAAQKELEQVVDPGLILIRGVEATTFRGHFNIWGIPDWVDFRVQSPQHMEAALRFANDRGALTSCSHPKPYGPAWEYPDIENYQCVEVWNGPWFVLNAKSLRHWLDLLAQGRRIPAVGGSDYHRPGEGWGDTPRNVGTPTNWVYVDGQPSSASILQAVRAGHVSLSDEPDGPFLDLRGGVEFAALGGDAIPKPGSRSLPICLHSLRGEGCLLQILDQNGVIHEQLITAQDIRLEMNLPTAGSLYIRAELRTDEIQLRAMTNPIYLE